MSGVKGALSGAALASAALLLFLALTPPLDDFDPLNPYWNGISGASSSLGLRQLPSFSAVQGSAASTAVLIIGPDESFESGYIESARQYLLSGGMIIVMDDFGAANVLLEGLGASIRVDGRRLLDPLYMVKSQEYPKATAAASGEIALDHASALSGASSTALAQSSAFSYLDENGNGRHDSGEPQGPFAVAASEPYGAGTIVAVSDSSLIINAVAPLGNNTAFIRSILGARAAYIDASHRAPSAFAAAKSGVNAATSYLSAPEARYAIAIAAAVAAFAVNWEAIGKDKRRKDIYEEELSRVAFEHPSWDTGDLRMIQEERRAAHG